MRMKKRLAAVLFLGLASTLVFTASPASAHGEKSQEAFLRMRTVAFTDVTFTGGRLQNGETHLKQGEFVVLKGVAKLMDTWPDTLAAGKPEIGYINIATQGPCVEMVARSINGVSTPGRIEIAKGRFYAFEMKLMGRRPGRWHVHPSFAVKGAGTVLGPGFWVNVEKASGGFQSPVTLYNGKTINLENYGLNMVWIVQVIGFILGMIWIFYWTSGSRNEDGSSKSWMGGHRTVTQPAVTLAIPLNDDGVAVGLNSKRDHRAVNMMLVATTIFLLVGWIYQASAYPVKIPQQVVQFAPPLTDIDSAKPAAEVEPLVADYEQESRQLSLEIAVDNLTDGPIELAEFTTSTLTFLPAGGSAATPSEYNLQMQMSPTGPIQAGEKKHKITLKIDGNSLVREHLVPTSESQLTMAGLMVFKDAAGKKTSVEIEEPLRPKFKE